jgi:hypothetical protein
VNTPVFVIYLTLVALGAVPAFVFPIYYAVKSKWRQFPHGRERETAGHLLAFSTFFALLYLRGGINLSTPSGRYAVLNQSPGGGAFLVFLAVFAAAVGWHRLWLFHRGRKERSK